MNSTEGAAKSSALPLVFTSFATVVGIVGRVEMGFAGMVEAGLAGMGARAGAGGAVVETGVDLPLDPTVVQPAPIDGW
jgi:hypothetical protein